jgi:hypothetical protein
MRLLIEQHKVEEEIAKATAHIVWNRMRPRNIRGLCENWQDGKISRRCELYH